MNCVCCGWEHGSFVLCDDCGQRFYWRCLPRHARKVHGRRLRPEADFRVRYHGVP